MVLNKIEKLMFGNLFRSEKMSLVQIAMQREVAYSIVEKLGDFGRFEFKDLSFHLTNFQRQYSEEIKRCEELERQLRFFADQMKNSELQTSELLSIDNDYDDFKQGNIFGDDIENTDTLEAFETLFEKYEDSINELNENLQKMITEKNQYEELHQVYKLGEVFIKGITGSNSSNNDEIGQISDEASSGSSDGHDEKSLLDFDHDNKNYSEGEGGVQMSGGLPFICGVIPRDKIPLFNVLMYRATRGNVVPRFSTIKKPMFDAKLNKFVEKSVFVVFLRGGSRIREKMTKVCDALSATIYAYPLHYTADQFNQLLSSISDLEKTISNAKQQKYDIFSKISINILKWRKKIAKEKSIYYTLNLFDYSVSKSQVIAEGWCPTRLKGKVESEIRLAEQQSKASVGSVIIDIDTKGQVPPTYFELNDFTEGFQSLVSSYSCPKYQEVNPMLTTTITFPFLFGMMYGDIGHGLLLASVGLVMILFQKKLKIITRGMDLLDTIFYGRFILFFMGLFSIYCGILYNEVFGLSFDVFGTAWNWNLPDLSGKKIKGYNYIIGIDPAWYGCENKLIYNNSIKMKISIIVGVIHMLLGIFYSLLNHIHFKHFHDIFFEFIPEVLILVPTFGYLCFMIIYKWLTDFVGLEKRPPSLLNTMCDFFLRPWELREEQLYPHQHIVQIIFLLIAAVNVPLLFFPKVIYTVVINFFKKKITSPHQSVNSKQKDFNGSGYEKNDEQENEEDSHYNALDDENTETMENEEVLNLESSSSKNDNFGVDIENIELEQEDEILIESEYEEEEFDFSDIFIKQLIHTIEFVLSCVSHTASYLRLWALSLAHSELSEVFWSMTLGLVLNLDGLLHTVLVQTGIAIIPIYFLWFTVFTCGVLIVMESLSALLHSLRLHWVEFQSKFYIGEGREFAPFSFEQIFEENQLW